LEISFLVKIYEILYSKILSLKSYAWESALRRKSGLDADADVREQLIPSTFEKETNFLSTENITTLRMHYMACNWQILKDFLNWNRA
jgi:hypothetical protein